MLLLAPALMRGEVADSSASGFTVKFSLNVQAPPADAYHKFIHNVGDWWSSDHTFSGSAHNLSIEEKAGGCFCEKLPDGGGARHLEVVNFVPGKQLVMIGGLGPLQALAATGSMTIHFASADGGTKVDVVYTVVGYMAAGMNTLAAPVDGVLRQQFDRMKNYVEHGEPAPKK
jgi:uncharacterized protein YndB with AHSA1/START domain